MNAYAIFLPLNSFKLISFYETPSPSIPRDGSSVLRVKERMLNVPPFWIDLDSVPISFQRIYMG